MKLLTLVIQKQGENDVLDFSLVDAEGKPQDVRLTQPHQGGKVTLSEPSPGDMFDDVTVAVPDNHHWVYVYKKNGKTVAERKVTLSADGKTHEAKMTGKLPDGKTMVEDDYMVRQ
jgi:hypothetical protein